MKYPDLLILPSEEDYRVRFESEYCTTPLVTFDGIKVRFKKSDFDHAFFESRKGGKDNVFSLPRAQRMLWISYALTDPDSERYQGWDKVKKRHDPYRRVTLVKYCYVVVISIRKNNPVYSYFKTAYVADMKARPGQLSTVDKIKMGPKWA